MSVKFVLVILPLIAIVALLYVSFDLSYSDQFVRKARQISQTMESMRFPYPLMTNHIKDQCKDEEERKSEQLTNPPNCITREVCGFQIPICVTPTPGEFKKQITSAIKTAKVNSTRSALKTSTRKVKSKISSTKIILKPTINPGWTTTFPASEITPTSIHKTVIDQSTTSKYSPTLKSIFTTQPKISSTMTTFMLTNPLPPSEINTKSIFTTLIAQTTSSIFTPTLKSIIFTTKPYITSISTATSSKSTASKKSEITTPSVSITNVFPSVMNKTTSLVQLTTTTKIKTKCTTPPLHPIRDDANGFRSDDSTNNEINNILIRLHSVKFIPSERLNKNHFSPSDLLNDDPQKENCSTVKPDVDIFLIPKMGMNSSNIQLSF